MAGGYSSYPSPGGDGGVAEYASFGLFPASPPAGVYLFIAADTDLVYVYDSTTASYVIVGGAGTPVQTGSLDGAAKNARAITVGSNTIYLQTADSVFPGVVSSNTQIWSGLKTFLGGVSVASIVSSGTIFTSGNVQALGTVTGSNVTGSNTGDVSLDNIGSSPSAAGASLSGQVLTLQPANALNGGVLSPVGVHQEIGGTKQFIAQAGFSSSITVGGNIVSSGSLDIAGNGIFTGLVFASNITGSNTGNVSVTNFGSSPNAAGASLVGQVLTLQPADGTNPGGLSTGAQTIAGAKTFSSTLTGTTVQVSANLIAGDSVICSNTVSGATISGTTVTGTNIQASSNITAGDAVISSNTMQSATVRATTALTSISHIIGSLTMNQTAGGAVYTVSWPAAQGGISTVLQNNGSGALTWSSALTNPMTTGGDIIVGSASGVAARLANGTVGQVLQSRGTTETPQWSNTLGSGSSGIAIAGTPLPTFASAGFVGELVVSSVSSRNVATTGFYFSVTQISVTPGDWDVSTICFIERGTASQAAFTIATSGIGFADGNSSAGAVLGENYAQYGSPGSGIGQISNVTPPWRFVCGSTTTLYLKCNATYASGLPTVGPATIRARRVR